MNNKFSISQEDLIVKDTGNIVDGYLLYELVQPLTFAHGVNGGHIKVTVPKGFITNFASIPRVFWSVLPPVGRYSKASVIHDYLYGLEGCSRFLADAMFREVMYQLGVPMWKRLVLYYGVRIFGGLKRSLPDKEKKAE